MFPTSSNAPSTYTSVASNGSVSVSPRTTTASISSRSSPPNGNYHFLPVLKLIHDAPEEVKPGLVEYLLTVARHFLANNNVQPPPARSLSCSDVAVFGGKEAAARSLRKKVTRTLSCTAIESIRRFPPGWRMSYTAKGKPYYLNSHNRTTTWSDPREAAAKALEKEAMRRRRCRLRMKVVLPSQSQSGRREGKSSCLQAVSNGRPITILLDTGAWHTVFDRSLITRPKEGEDVFKVKETHYSRCIIGGVSSSNLATKCLLTHSSSSSGGHHHLPAASSCVELTGYVDDQRKSVYKVDARIGRKDLPKILKPEALDGNGRAFFDTIYGPVYYSSKINSWTGPRATINWKAGNRFCSRTVRRSLSCTDLDTVADLLPESWMVAFDNDNRNVYYRNRLVLKEWSWEAPRRTLQLKEEESFKASAMMKRSESTGNLFVCTSRSHQSGALVIRVHCTTNQCTIWGRSCHDGSMLKIVLHTGSSFTFISRSRTPPSAIFTVPDIYTMKGPVKSVSTNEVTRVILAHRYTQPVQVFAYVLDEHHLPEMDILLGRDYIAQILKPEALDSNGHRAYLDTIYGRVYLSYHLWPPS